MKVVIAKVGEVLFDGEAHLLTAPGADGVLTVLPRHMPLITTLVAGDVILKESKDSTPRTFPISSGILEVHPGGATVIL